MGLNPQRVVFKEPEGTATSLVFLAISLAFLAMHAYYGLHLDGSAMFSLVMGVAFAITAVAEALPPDRRRVAGGLRVLATGILVVQMVLLFVAPDVLWP